MKILMVPCATGGKSHQIPLLVLSQRLSRVVEDGLDLMFLLPDRDKPGTSEGATGSSGAREQFDAIGAKVWNEDYTGKPSELAEIESRAYRSFMPDIVIDDFNEATTLAMQSLHLPRISVQRTGVFPAATMRNPGHCHSAVKVWIQMLHRPSLNPVLRAQLYSRIKRHLEPDYFFRCFRAESKLIPGIPQIERLPPSLKGDQSYYFSGPLILQNSEMRLPQLDAFFEHNEKRKKVYVTVGLIQPPWPVLQNCISDLIKQDIAVVSNFPPLELDDRLKPLSFSSRFLPLDPVCQRVDLIVHQCGSGIYHYPLLHQKPSVTLGTQCYDREDIATTLQLLGTSVHIPSPAERIDFRDRFDVTIRESLARPQSMFDLSAIARVKQQLDHTIEHFDYARLLEDTLSRFSTFSPTFTASLAIDPKPLTST